MRKSIISTVLISALLLTSCGTPVVEVKKEITKKPVSTEVIKKDVFSEKIRLVGKIAPVMETPVSAQVSGIIKKINADVGKKVKAGDILASIDLSSSAYWTNFNNANIAYNNSLNALNYTELSIKNDLESARVQLENAKVTKTNTYLTTAKQLEIAQGQLTNIKTNRSNTEITTWESLKNATLLVKNAQTNLDNFEKNSEENLNSIYENLKVGMSSALVNLDASVTQADIILGVTDKNKYINDNYEMYLGAKNSSLKTSAENIFREVKNSYDKLLSENYSLSKSSIENKTNDILNILAKNITLYEQLVNILNNSITSSSFSQTQLDWLSLNVVKYQGLLLQSQGALTTLKNTLATTKTSVETNKISLQNALDIANTGLANIKAWNTSQLDTISGNETITSTQLENTIATVKQARDSVDNAVKIAQANYDSINAKLNSQRIQAKSQADQAKWGKDLAGISLNNTSIIAPFDGVVTAKNIEIGSLVNPGTPAFTIWTDDNLKVKLEVSTNDFASFKIGNNVEIHTKEKTFSWIISNVSPSPDTQTKLYKTEVSFVFNPSSILTIWDFVDVFLNKKMWNELIISVPLSSVITLDAGRYWVFTINKDDSVKLNYVVLGKKNNTHVEIISGLEEWIELVIEGALGLNEGDAVEKVGE
ncbi:MAG: efflux transporter, RND family, MFP subunit [uncultured bacterium (gcode 4)]|uniref:Efflux transporter, RND family, MFP subunit n=1 Tax=uncultured bacterium (gcode 4) TaxID=1234023 RepID=K2BVL6_9BACT|nr:MAG: efflux transporter, RND family, MFP subunit [uncultured bacterium (gcode 4)]